jgi:ribose/xylose/arabinose/galactoside ABC-type transport system permease subunit
MIKPAFVAHRSTRSLVLGILPFALLAVMILAFVIVPGFSDREVTDFNVYNAFQYFAAAGLLALGLGITMIAGEFDLSTLGVYALSAMIAVKYGNSSPIGGILLAVGAAVIIGLIQGTLIAKLRITSMTVTLGGYIALLGLTSVLSDDQSLSYSNLDVGSTLDDPVATFFSLRSLIAIAAFLIVAGVLRYTVVGRHLRAIGGDRRASRTVGVKVDPLLIGVFVASAVLSALGGSLLGYSLATAVPDPGLSPLIFGITATLLGGVTLAGGKGGAMGIAAGALTLALLAELFVVLATPTYVSDLVTGGLLLVVTIFSAPDIIRWWRRTVPARQRPVADEAPRATAEGAPAPPPIVG